MENKKPSFGEYLMKGAVVRNPVLIQLAGICTVAAVSSSLYSGLFFSAVFTAVTLLNCLFASLFLKKVQRPVRVIFYLFVSLAVICPLMYLFEVKGTGLGETVRLYLPLLAVNSVTAVHCEQFAVKHPPLDSVKDAISVSIGYSAVMIALSLVREVLGRGELAGRKLPGNFALPGLLMPFGSFVILGFFAVGLKWYISRYQPEMYEETAVNIKTARLNFREKEESGEAPETEASPEEQAAFLFGNEAEDELFTEFWVENPLNSENIVENIAALTQKNEQFGNEAQERMNELLGRLDRNLDFDKKDDK